MENSELPPSKRVRTGAAPGTPCVQYAAPSRPKAPLQGEKAAHWASKPQGSEVTGPSRPVPRNLLCLGPSMKGDIDNTGIHRSKNI
jgi:hypothetical protein